MLSQVIFQFWTLFAEMAAWLLFGFLVAGIVGAVIPSSFFERHLGKEGIWSVVKASLIGVPLPLCSCSVVPTGVALRKKGATVASSISFLISTPQTGIDSIFLTCGALGFPFALIKVCSAFVMGIIGGVFVGPGEPSREVDVNITKECLSRKNIFKKAYEFSFVELPATLVRPFLIGVLLSAVVSAFLQPGSFEQWLGEGLIAIPVMLIISVPLYVCSTASIPLALMMAEQGVHPGAIFVFLMAGPATNAATILMVGKSLGKKALACYLGTIIIGSSVVGLCMGSVLLLGNTSLGHIHEELSWVHHGAGTVLALLFLPPLIKPLFPPRKISASDTLYRLSGLTCNGCVSKLESSLVQVGIPVKSVGLHSLVVQSGEPSQDTEIRKVVRELGFGLK